MSVPTDDAEGILRLVPLQGLHWETPNPFLFCAHHDDRYPAGNALLGPDTSLAGRELGQDFEGKDGWRMYHGEIVPGFPQHPHRGFETVTLVRRGFIDHADSLGAAARFGEGDVQWLTAGRGINHSEMFPLLNAEESNPVELFQIWLNLPRSHKMVEPHFSMLWHEVLPTHRERNESGATAEVTLIAGALGSTSAPHPPPKSWASSPGSEVAIWTIRLSPEARWTLPAASPGLSRALYFFQGDSLIANGRTVSAPSRLDLLSHLEASIQNGPASSELLLLQGRPILESTVQYGPFVMNSRDEIQQAFADYQRTGFGGWPWPSSAPVHPREERRFARHADGRLERPASR